ncbi:MAG: SagB/ThcOx family dehydrogenase [Gemmatimonadales bacterium]|nr:SagB/ThcOx family dehydrogenase [Gemmatimonadales bacterium]
MRVALAVVAVVLGVEAVVAQEPGSRIVLPQGDPAPAATLGSLLDARRSVREFSARPFELAEVARVLWAAIGVNRPDGRRTVPSAGALFPLELYVVAGDVAGLVDGVYRYVPLEHALEPTADGDRRAALAQAALRQAWVGRAPVVLVVAAEYERTTVKYGDRGVRYAHMEVGGVAQNVYLQSAALGLGTTFVGAFDDEEVGEVLGLPVAHRPLGLLPVGSPAIR